MPAPDKGKPSRRYKGRCTEDMPCWDCRTMGNKKCGRRHRNGPRRIRKTIFNHGEGPQNA